MKVTMQLLDELMQSDTAISGTLKHIKEKNMTHEQLRSYFATRYAPLVREHMRKFDEGTLFRAQTIHFSSWVRRVNRIEDMEKLYEVRADFEMAGLKPDERLEDFASARLYHPTIIDEMKPLLDVENSGTWNAAMLEWSNVNRQKHWQWNVGT